jgi:hypothetical protein
MEAPGSLMRRWQQNTRSTGKCFDPIGKDERITVIGFHLTLNEARGVANAATG